MSARSLVVVGSRKSLALVLFMSGVAQLVGAPGDLPGLLLWAYGLITRPEVVAIGNQAAVPTFNTLLVVGSAFLFFGRNPFSYLDRSRPRLRLDGGEVVTQKMRAITIDGQQSISTATFAYARVSNLPEGEPTDKSEARQVVAHITYCNTDRSPLYRSMVARWSDMPEVGRGFTPVQLHQIDMPPNGLPFRIDVAIKHPKERDAYGWNNESDQNSEVQERRDARFRLPPGTYEVRVELTGVNARETFWLTLTNNGRGKPMQVVPSTYRSGIRRLIPARRRV